MQPLTQTGALQQKLIEIRHPQAFGGVRIPEAQGHGMGVTKFAFMDEPVPHAAGDRMIDFSANTRFQLIGRQPQPEFQPQPVVERSYGAVRRQHSPENLEDEYKNAELVDPDMLTTHFKCSTTMNTRKAQLNPALMFRHGPTLK